MSWWQAVVLGIVEGVTEYLPVSSTGHLLLAQRAMGISSSEAADAFAICIQAGAILAVLGLYSQRVKHVVEGFLGRNPMGARLGICLGAAFLPAAILGTALEKVIKRYLFGGEEWGLWPIVAAWFVGGFAIVLVEKWRRRRGLAGRSLEDMTWQMGVIIGIAQCVAMWPGTSRSLATILGGIFAGLNLCAAVEFSFLLGVITLTAATAYDALKHGNVMMNEYGWEVLSLGLFTSWLSAVLAVKWMVGYL
ncbi:MAG: undecaprenyl-diphosphate phosphatase, partial [Chthoniobacterales bacterium]|nr:undecaprenyl-diphosphate phosphatase [Chthoniobacterales bacterium]